MEQLIEILEDIHPGVDFAAEKSLVTDGILKSFDILTLISEIDAEMGVEIPVEDVTPEHFESVEAILQLIEASGKA